MNRKVAPLMVVTAVIVGACAEPTTPPSVVSSEQQASYRAAPAASRVPDQYIVVFRDDVSDIDGETERLAGQHGAAVLHTYRGVLRGFAARMPAQAAAALSRNPNVEYVEEDQEYTINATQTGAVWGIDRIDQRSLPVSGTYNYTTTASNVRVYIIDTGLDAAHAEFEGRASNVYDALGGNGTDCHGHGTHVGGTVGGKLYGVAKKSMLRGVRVLNCSGSGSNSGIIAGMDYVRLNHIKPAVANMSLGGGYSSSLNTATTNLSNAGVFVAVAAGNSNANACNYSPASASSITTVAASTSSDAKASYSNYGSCVEVYAPGSSIKSAWIGSGTTETNTINGTSMASPHVAGVAALYKATYGDASWSTINSWIINNSTANVITGNVTGTPNRLLYKGTM